MRIAWNGKKTSFIIKRCWSSRYRTWLEKRKLVRGNTVSDEIFQVNCKYDGEIKDEAPPAEAAARCT